MSAFLSYLPGHTPLVLDSPHSGTRYPADFAHACDPLVLRRAEDTHVEKLYDFAPELGAAWLEAYFPPRCRRALPIAGSLITQPWRKP